MTHEKWRFEGLTEDRANGKRVLVTRVWMNSVRRTAWGKASVKKRVQAIRGISFPKKGEKRKGRRIPRGGNSGKSFLPWVTTGDRKYWRERSFNRADVTPVGAGKSKKSKLSKGRRQRQCPWRLKRRRND